jgi:hypothetical protein
MGGGNSDSVFLALVQRSSAGENQQNRIKCSNRKYRSSELAVGSMVDLGADGRQHGPHGTNWKETTEMPHKLLITSAAAALLAGTLMAGAQSTPKQAPSGGMEKGAPAQGQVQGQEPQGQGSRENQPGRENQKQGQGKGDPSKSQTTGQGQRDPGKGEPSKGENQKQGQGKGDPAKGENQKQGQGKGDPSKSQTTGQGQRDQGKQQGQQRDQNEGRQGGDTPRQGAQQGGQSGSGNFTAEQRTKIRETVIKTGPRVTNVTFAVNVGTVVPETVRVVAVPEVIIEVHPEWRGFLYFVYEDEIVIVDRSHKIVAVIAV